MDQYRKKVNIAGKTKRIEERHFRDELPTYRYDVYLQRSIERQNLEPQNNPINISGANDSIPKFRNKMQDLFADDETKSKAIKYVIKTRHRSPSPSDEFDQRNRILSPKNGNKTSKRQKRNLIMEYPRDLNRNNRLYKDPYSNSICNTSRNVGLPTNPNTATPNYPSNYAPISSRQNQNRSRINVSASRNDTKENDEDIYNENDNQLVEEGIEESSGDNDDNGVNSYSINKRYKIPKKKMNLSRRENKDNLNLNEEDIDELIRAAEDFQSIINGQKHEISLLKNQINIKNKENNMLRDELEDRRIEHEK